MFSMIKNCRKQNFHHGYRVLCEHATKTVTSFTFIAVIANQCSILQLIDQFSLDFELIKTIYFLCHIVLNNFNFCMSASANNVGFSREIDFFQTYLG